MAIDHTEIIPGKTGFDLKMFTDPQRSFGMTELTTEDLVRIARDIHSFLGIRMWLVTVKLPKQPGHLSALKCKHSNYDKGHCAEMGCSNYINRCPRHAMAHHEEDRCTREKVTEPCEFSPYCTDRTGEHHTLLVYAATDGQALEHAEEEMRERGYTPHITRVEAVG